MDLQKPLQVQNVDLQHAKTCSKTELQVQNMDLSGPEYGPGKLFLATHSPPPAAA